MFGKVAGPMGIKLDRPIRVELRDDRTETYVKSIHSQLTSEVRELDFKAVVLNVYTFPFIPDV